MSAPIPSPTSFTCSECGFSWSHHTLLCPRCGEALFPTLQPKGKAVHIVGRCLGALGGFIGVLANVNVLYVTFGFYQAAAIIPAGTHIRPMALVAFYFMIGSASAVFGVPISLKGTTLCERAQDARGALWAKIGASLSILPLPLSIVLFYLITALCGLKLAD